MSGVRHRFFRKKQAVAGLMIIAFFFFLAVFAPFIAGNRPLVFDDGEGIRYPVFQAFTAEDILWLGGFGTAFFTWALAVFLRRRRSPSRKVKIFFAALLSIVVLVVGINWPERLDRSDYRPYRDGAMEAKTCVMPPVPWSPYELVLKDRIQPPGAVHWLGTDGNGRDVLSRLIHGARVSMLVGFAAVGIYVLIGLGVGALAGYFGGWVDLALSRFMEAVICFPSLFAILAVLCFLPPSVLWVMLLIGLLRWPGVARLVRGEFLRLKSEDFVTAGRAMGLSDARMIFRHFLPNALGPVLVAATFGIAGAILLESGLSFLGFGVQPPTPSWGEMLSSGKSFLDRAWGLTVFPGLAIFLAVTAFNLVGEGLRDALDPRLRKR
jgi:peptide/nickel transport system permease protein